MINVERLASDERLRETHAQAEVILEPRAAMPCAFARICETRRRGDFRMMAEPVASLKNMEFPKNSINIDKFTGFFDK